MKKALKIIGILVLLLLLTIGGCTGWVLLEKSRYSSTAVPYLKKVIPEISRWDPAIIRSHMAPEALETISDADFQKFVQWLSKLGSLKSMEDPTFVKVFSGVSTDKGRIKTVAYTTVAHFDAGDALITTVLLDKTGSFSIYRFNISSKALVG